MATKTQITNKVDTDLASASSIEASDHRSVLHGSTDSLIDNFYGIKTGDTNGSTNVVTQTNANLGYVISTIKQGGKVSQNGTLTNNTGVMTPSTTQWFTITTSEYLQQGSTSIKVNATLSSTGDNIRCKLVSNVLTTTDPIAIGQTVLFNLTYNTQD